MLEARSKAQDGLGNSQCLPSSFMLLHLVRKMFFEFKLILKSQHEYLLFVHQNQMDVQCQCSNLIYSIFIEYCRHGPESKQAGNSWPVQPAGCFVPAAGRLRAVSGASEPSS